MLTTFIKVLLNTYYYYVLKCHLSSTKKEINEEKRTYRTGVVMWVIQSSAVFERKSGSHSNVGVMRIQYTIKSHVIGLK